MSMDQNKPAGAGKAKLIGIELKPVGFKKAKLLDQIKENGLGGVLLTSPENVFYTTGFPALPTSGNPINYTLRKYRPFFSYISAEGQIFLSCWELAAEGMTYGVDEVRGFDTMEQAQGVIARLIQEKLDSRKPLGIESTCPYYVTELLKANGAAKTFSVVDRIMENLRLVKSPEEIALIKKSTEIIEKTMTELMDEVVYVGMSRLELIQEGKARLYKNGGTGVSHATFAFGIVNPEIAIGEILEEGKLVTLDLGGIYEGYASDTRRYVYAGTLDPYILKLHGEMVDIVDRVGESLRPGVRFCDVYEYALSLYASHNLTPKFARAGHSIGLETEDVWIRKEEERKIEPGMVLNIELYSDPPTGEHVGNEETYVIDEHGSKRISVLPREIRKIG